MVTLVSPGVSVTITNDSYYIPATAPTVPLIILATQENKTYNGAPCPGTQEYGVVRTITSLSQSVSTFGIPSFLTTNGAPNNGDCRNEYGLATLNAALGILDYAYTIRANVNLDDNFTDIQTLWQYYMGGTSNNQTTYGICGQILLNLIQENINQTNINNGAVPGNPNYVTSINTAELISLMQTATQICWEDFTFSRGSPSSLQTDFFANLSASGVIQTTGTLTQPTGGTVTNGAYSTVALAGGTGAGASASIIVSGGIVTSVTVVNGGHGYSVNDVLTYSGNGVGTGGTITVTATASAAFPVYGNGFSQPTTGSFIGMAGYLAAGFGSDSGLSTPPNYQWTANEGSSTLASIAGQFMWTQDFLFKTMLGADDTARRAVIVQALNAIITGNEDIRAESIQYNLVLCPGYTECTTNLVSLTQQYLNSEVFVIGDVPMNVDMSALSNWAGSSTRVIDVNGDVAYYYPHCLTTNLDGSTILVPSSAWALRTYAYSDNVSYEWFAPAGLRRGVMTGLTDIGYVDPNATLGTAAAFVELYPNQGQRDLLYAYTAGGNGQVGGTNPMAFFPGEGFVVWGQKTSTGTTASALDRVNVSRLVKYIARSLRENTMSFVFEPNDSLTQNSLKALVDGFLGNLITLRGLYDFASVCDSSNNPPAVVDANELFIDVAIQPVKAAEFIYIPITIVATGASLTTGGAVQSAQ
jgi:hypothetical protein